MGQVRHMILINFERQNPPLRFLSSDGRCGVDVTNELAKPFLKIGLSKNFLLSTSVPWSPTARARQSPTKRFSSILRDKIPLCVSSPQMGAAAWT